MHAAGGEQRQQLDAPAYGANAVAAAVVAATDSPMDVPHAAAVAAQQAAPSRTVVGAKRQNRDEQVYNLCIPAFMLCCSRQKCCSHAL